MTFLNFWNTFNKYELPLEWEGEKVNKTKEMDNEVSKSFLMKYHNIKCILVFSLILCHFCIWNILQRQWVLEKCQHKAITTFHHLGIYFSDDPKNNLIFFVFFLFLWTTSLNWNKIFRSQLNDRNLRTLTWFEN